MSIFLVPFAALNFPFPASEAVDMDRGRPGFLDTAFISTDWSLLIFLFVALFFWLTKSHFSGVEIFVIVSDLATTPLSPFLCPVTDSFVCFLFSLAFFLDSDSDFGFLLSEDNCFLPKM